MTGAHAAFEALFQQIHPHGRIVAVRPLTGGISAQVSLVELETEDVGTQRYVVRQHGPVDLAHNPRIAEDEFALLKFLQRAGLPVPQAVLVDSTCDLFATPVLVESYVEGSVEFPRDRAEAALSQMATFLARLHHITPATAELAFLPQLGRGFGDRPGVLDESLNEGRIRDRLEQIQFIPPPNTPVLLHGDFWPGNVLWRAGQLAAIIDWEDAALGDPLADLANARLEILWAQDVDAMNIFTAHYRRHNPLDFTHLPYWDLCAALRPASKLASWGLAADVVSSMQRKHRQFVDDAMAALSQ